MVGGKRWQVPVPWHPRYYKAMKKRLCPKNILPSLSLIEMMSPINGLCSTSITSPSIQSGRAVNCGLTFILSPIFGSIFSVFIVFTVQRYKVYLIVPSFYSFFLMMITLIMFLTVSGTDIRGCRTLEDTRDRQVSCSDGRCLMSEGWSQRAD